MQNLDVKKTPVSRIMALEHRLGLPRDALLGYALLAPGLVLIFALVGIPFVNSIWLSFHRKFIGFQNPPFVGLDNYTSLLADGDFWIAVRNVLVYVAFAILFKLVLGLIVALIINQPLPFRGLIRSFILLPWALPTLVTVLTWRWMYHDLFGVFNHVLMQLGLIESPIAWLARRDLAMPAVILVNIWRGFPFFAVTLLAGLQGIPDELHDAAKVDGASVLQRFWHVTLPGVAPVMAVVTVLSTIWTFNDFVIIWLLTTGGPGNATEVLTTLTYRVAIIGRELGKGVAVSVMLMPLLMVLIIFLTRLTTQRESEV